jgi:membrane peptidoglycan carboxypeptidase
VHSKDGKDVEIAGKTGTAQVGTRTEGGYEAGTHAWFIGYAPAGRPRIAFAVMVEHGGHGGDVAAPIAMEIVRNTFDTVMPAERDAPRVGRAVRRAARVAEAAGVDPEPSKGSRPPAMGPGKQSSPSPDAPRGPTPTAAEEAPP